jgi:hypothetical protein
MSGPICPDCEWGIIREGATRAADMRCVLCGWVGEGLPYKRLHTRDHERMCAERDAKAAARAAGKLYFVRVDYDPALSEPMADALSEAIRTLVATSPKNWRNYTPGAYFYCELTARPSGEVMEHVVALPNVLGARLYEPSAPDATSG